MAWPTTKVSTEPWEARSFDGTLLGAFYRVWGGSEISGLFGPFYSIKQRREIIDSLDYFRLLSSDVRDKLSRSSYTQMRRMIYSWRAVEDCILFSTPELVNHRAPQLLLKLWVWHVSTHVHSSAEVCRVWKLLALHIKHTVLASPDRHENPFPRGLPGGNRGRIGELWFDAMPWLRDIYLSTSFGSLLTKNLLERVGLLSQHRNQPPPELSFARYTREVDEWKAVLGQVQTLDLYQYNRVRKAMVGITSALLKHPIETSRGAHVSLSASACFGCSRSQGGRVIDFLRSYIDLYVMRPSKLTLRSVTWFGAPYNLVEGYPRAWTMCRESPLRRDLTSFLSSAFRTEFASGTCLLASILGADEQSLPLEEPIFGLDAALPLQILQLAIELCCEAGYLASPSYGAIPVGSFAYVPVRAKAHPVCEPGNKVRWVTMEPSYVTVCLQPLAHWLANVIQHYSCLISAFTRTYKAWDFIVGLQRDGVYDPEKGFGTYDLTGASNQLNRTFCVWCGAVVIEAFTRDVTTRFLLHNLLNLLVGDREIWVTDREDGERHRVVICTNGLLMGNPGTKELLCLTSACLHVMTVNEYGGPPPRMLIAGDDVIVYSSPVFFRRLLAMNTEFGNVINKQKSLFSKLGAFFTEEVLKLIPNAFGCGKEPWKMADADHMHVDMLKLRLLSPFGTQSLENDETFQNPAVGKAGALKNFLSWTPNSAIKWLAPRRFIHWMADHISYDYGRRGYSHADPIVHLGHKFGGWDIPFIGSWENLLGRFVEDVNPLFFRLFRIMSEEQDYHSIVDFLLRRMATGNSVRGLVDPMLYLLTAQYAGLAYVQFASRAKTFDFFKVEFAKKHSYPPRPSDILRLARDMGYVGWHDVALNLDRLTAIRIGFCCAAGHLQLEDVVGSLRDDGLPSPNQVLVGFVEQELNVMTPGFSEKLRYFRTEPDDYMAFRNWLLGRQDDIVLRAKQWFLPGECIRDSLNGMVIPLPYTPPRTKIPGSEDDPDADASVKGYIAQIVSLRRLSGNR